MEADNSNSFSRGTLMMAVLLLIFVRAVQSNLLFVSNPESNTTHQNKVFLPLVMMWPTHYYVQAIKQGSVYYGVRATIETADPEIREPKFSYTTINISDAYGQWIETGWVKSSESNPKCVLIFIWSTDKLGGRAQFLPSPRPIVGSKYQYVIYRRSADNWRLQILSEGGSLLHSVDISNPGMTSGNLLQAGGEVHSPQRKNDMGIAGILNLKLRDQSGTWLLWNSWEYGTYDHPPYNLYGVLPDGDNNIQISGNNGTPMPPDPACP